jgi:hypothetical protein
MARRSWHEFREISLIFSPGAPTFSVRHFDCQGNENFGSYLSMTGTLGIAELERARRVVVAESVITSLGLGEAVGRRLECAPSSGVRGVDDFVGDHGPPTCESSSGRSGQLARKTVPWARPLPRTCLGAHDFICVKIFCIAAINREFRRRAVGSRLRTPPYFNGSATHSSGA